VSEAQAAAAEQTAESLNRAISLYQQLDLQVLELVEAVSQDPPTSERSQGLDLLRRYRTNVLTGLSAVYADQGRHDQALSALTELRKFVEQGEEPFSRGITYKSLGDLHREHSQPSEAWAFYQKALATFPTEAEYEPFIRHARLGAYQALEAMGMTREALEQLNLVEESANQIEDIDQQQKALHYLHFNRGYFFLRHGHNEEARKDLLALMELPYVQQSPLLLFRSALSLISASRRIGDNQAAWQYLDLAEKALAEVKPEEVSPSDRSLYLLSKGSLEVLDGDVAAGLSLLEESEDLHKSSGFAGLSAAFAVRFSTYESQGRGAELLPVAEAYLETVEEPTESDIDLILSCCKILAQTGQPDEALQRLQDLITVLEARNARANLLQALTALGNIYDSFQLDEKAEFYYSQALKIAREMDSRDQILTLESSLFRTKLRQPYYLNDPVKLRRDFERLAEAYQSSSNPSGFAVLMTGYFRELVDSDETEQAAVVLQQMKETVAGLGPVVDDFILYGESLLARRTENLEVGSELLSRLEKGAEEGTMRRQMVREILYWRQLLGQDLETDGLLNEFERLSEEISVPGDLAYNLMFRAYLARRAGEIKQARGFLEEAEDIIWSLRDSSASREFPTAFHDTAQQVFGTMVELLVDYKLLEEAFQAAERGRGQALGFLFALGDSRIAALATPEQKERLSRLYAQRESLEEAYLEKTGSQAGVLSELESVASEIDDLLAEIAFARTGSRVTRITRDPADVESLRKALEPGALLLYYYTAENHSYRFSLARNRELEVAELPDGVALMELVKRLTASVLRREDSLALARETGEILLKGVDFQGVDRVVIVPDGPLYLLPFSLLETGSGPLSRFKPTILPSAKVLVDLPRETSSENGEITVVADPVYQLPERPGETQGFPEFQPLPGTAVEAAIVEELAHEEGYEVKLLTGDEATRDNIFRASDNGKLKESRIVHFATHGYLDPKDARLSGLVLSTVDNNGKGVNAYLRLVDIYRLELDSDLVVLSACQTGLGTIRQGEGLQGLYQGFMMAGSRAVLSTLWSIDDDGTAAFMRYFYTNLMNGSEPRLALSQAQQSMASSDRWSSPFYWAGFQLVSR